MWNVASFSEIYVCNLLVSFWRGFQKKKQRFTSQKQIREIRGAKMSFSKAGICQAGGPWAELFGRRLLGTAGAVRFSSRHCRLLEKLHLHTISTTLCRWGHLSSRWKSEWAGLPGEGESPEGGCQQSEAPSGARPVALQERRRLRDSFRSVAPHLLDDHRKGGRRGIHIFTGYGHQKLQLIIFADILQSFAKTHLGEISQGSEIVLKQL
jgi:hypothetical protein